MGVTTMKMIRRTRTTSTRGVTLISDLTSGWLSDPTCIGSSTLLYEIIQQLVGRITHFNIEPFDAVHEIVVHPYGRDRNEQTKRCCYESFCNTCGYCTETSRTGHGHSTESVNDSYDRTEKTNKRSSSSNCC